ncbi:hypothetical protein ACSSS7_006160 [Eimeria intestinalis]
MGCMRFTAEDQRHLDAYLEYNALVGQTDGGRLLSTELPNSSISSSSSMQQQEERELRVACKVPRCACPHFTFIPIQGSADLRCRCKHSFVDHHPATRRCLKCSDSTRGPPSASRGGPLLSKRGGPPSAAGARAAPGARTHAGVVGPPSSGGPPVCEGFDSPMKCSCGKSFAMHETRFWFDSDNQGAPHAKRGPPPRAPGQRRMHQNLVPMGGLTIAAAAVAGCSCIRWSQQQQQQQQQQQHQQHQHPQQHHQQQLQ